MVFNLLFTVAKIRNQPCFPSTGNKNVSQWNTIQSSNRKAIFHHLLKLDETRNIIGYIQNKSKHILLVKYIIKDENFSQMLFYQNFVISRMYGILI